MCVETHVHSLFSHSYNLMVEVMRRNYYFPCCLRHGGEDPNSKLRVVIKHFCNPNVSMNLRPLDRQQHTLTATPMRQLSLQFPCKYIIIHYLSYLYISIQDTKNIQRVGMINYCIVIPRSR